MPTILEFNELGVGQQITLATTDRGNVSGVAVDPSTLPTVGGLVSFLTVARASANRMLDAPLSMVAAWQDGQALYTSSCGGAGWHWQANFPAATATDNITTCRPTSWIAGGLPGAAVRSLAGNASALLQAAWRISTGAIDNEGAGTLVDPVQTIAEVQRRLGPSPDIAIDMTITFAQAPAQPGAAFTANVLNNAHLGLVGTPVTALEDVEITAVQAQVRTSGAEVPHAVTGVGLGAHVGKMLIIRESATPGHIGGNARILADLGGGKVMISPFGNNSPDLYFSFIEFSASVGDVVDVVAPMALPFSSFRFYGKTNRFDPYIPNIPPRNCVTTDWILFDGTDDVGEGSPQGLIEANNITVFYFTTILKNLFTCGFQNVDGGGQVLSGGGFDGELFSSNLTLDKCGGLNAFGIFGSQGFCSISADTYFQNTVMAMLAGPYATSFGGAFWNQSSALFGAIHLREGATWKHFGAVPDWGAGNAGYAILVQGQAGYFYKTTKPTVRGALGDTFIGGTIKAYAAVPYAEVTNGTLATVALQVGPP